MREMGATELLTREGEIALARRIEEGRNEMIRAISSCPATIAGILALADGVASGETRIEEFVDGIIDPSAVEKDDGAAVPVEGIYAEPAFNEDRSDDDGDNTEAAPAKRLYIETLERDALAKLAKVADWFAKLRNSYETEGYGSGTYRTAQAAIEAELIAIRFTARTVARLCDALRASADEARTIEREIVRIAVDRCGMPRSTFVAHFRGNETNPAWSEQLIAEGQPLSHPLQRNLPSL